MRSRYTWWGETTSLPTPPTGHLWYRYLRLGQTDSLGYNSVFPRVSFFFFFFGVTATSILLLLCSKPPYPPRWPKPPGTDPSLSPHLPLTDDFHSARLPAPIWHLLYNKTLKPLNRRPRSHINKNFNRVGLQWRWSASHSGPWGKPLCMWMRCWVMWQNGSVGPGLRARWLLSACNRNSRECDNCTMETAAAYLKQPSRIHIHFSYFNSAREPHRYPFPFSLTHPPLLHFSAFLILFSFIPPSPGSPPLHLFSSSISLIAACLNQFEPFVSPSPSLSHYGASSHLPSCLLHPLFPSAPYSFSLVSILRFLLFGIFPCRGRWVTDFTRQRIFPLLTH